MPDSNGEFPTVLGPDASFKGELKFDKGVKLLGRFEGTIQTKGLLLVAEGAKLTADVNAANVSVDGEVKGNLNASDKVHLRSSARLEGDLNTSRLEVADGAVFIGKCVVGANGSDKGAAPKAAPPMSAPDKPKQPEPVSPKK